MSGSGNSPPSVPGRQSKGDPAGFAERGVVVAFTTPQLFGACVSRALPGAQPHVTLSCLAGESGPMTLSEAQFLRTPWLTAHDKELWKKLQAIPEISPDRLREAMISVALEGWRGRAAMAWADEQKAADSNARRRMFFLLLTDLIRRTELHAEAKVPPEQESLLYLRPRIGKAVARIAKRFSMTVEAVEAALEALASVLMPLCKRNDSVTGHNRRAVADLQSFITELEQWLAPRRNSARGFRAEFLLRKAKLSLICAQAAMSELDLVIEDTTILLRAWQRDQAAVLRRVTRPQWLLDGWDIIIALWRQSEPSDREACFWEMSDLVPSLPKEVEGWSGFPDGASKIRQEEAAGPRSMDWRRLRPLEFIARNETLLTGKHDASLAAEAKKLREADLVQSRHSLTQAGHDGNDGADALSRISQRTSLATDSVLRQVVAILEAVPARAMLDPIIEAARPRLKLLRPPRPVTFTRILFLPFDGAVVPMNEWRAGSAKLPRPALQPIADALREVLGPEVQQISAKLGGRNFFDVLQVDSEGRALWAEAARVSATLSFPQGLPSIGLDAAATRQLLDLVASIWRHADGIWEAKLASFSGPSPELVMAALKGPAEEGQAAFSLAVASLLDRAQSPSSVLSTATRISGVAVSIIDETLQALQRNPLPTLPSEDPVRAAQIAEEYVALLSEFEIASRGRIKDQQKIFAPLLDNIGSVIKEATQQIINRQFLPALHEPNAKRRAAVVLNIEILARALRRLEEAGRRAGRFQAFDNLQISHSAKIKAILNALDGGGLQRHDIMRFAEILLGTEKAMALAAPPAKPAPQR